MEHHVAKAVPGRLLFSTWAEGLELWDRVLQAVPGPVAFFVMPDHLHLLCREGQRAGLSRALRAYARWRNARRGQRGALLVRSPAPTRPLGRLKEWRDERYIHLQACRGGLAPDPLCWPLSTHRDAVGLALSPVRAAVPDPRDYHHRTSADGTVSPAGTELPWVSTRRLAGEDGVQLVGEAVSALSRTPWSEMTRRGPARTLWVRSTQALVEATPEDLTRVIGVCERTQRRTRDQPAPRQLQLIERVVGDPRFAALPDGDLRSLPEWQRYIRRQIWREED